MRDRTIDHSRPDAGESMKDIKTPGKGLKPHAAYERAENYRIEEILPKLAQAAVPDIKDPEDKQTPEEYSARTERVTKLLGTLLGAGYGTIAGGFVGGEVLGNTPGLFDRKRGLRGALAGMATGGVLGFGGGTLYNKIRRYVGAHHPQHPPQQPVIQIVMPHNANVLNEVDDAIKAGSASVRTAAIFAGYKTAAGLGGARLGGAGGSGGTRLSSSTMGKPLGAGVGMNAGAAQFSSPTAGKPVGAGVGLNAGRAQLSSSTAGQPVGAGVGLNAGKAQLSSSTLGKPVGAGVGLNAGSARLGSSTLGKPVGAGVGLNAGAAQLSSSTAGKGVGAGVGLNAGAAQLSSSTAGKGVGAGVGLNAGAAQLSTPTVGKPVGAGVGLNAGKAQLGSSTAGKGVGAGVGVSSGGTRLGGSTPYPMSGSTAAAANTMGVKTPHAQMAGGIGNSWARNDWKPQSAQQRYAMPNASPFTRGLAGYKAMGGLPRQRPKLTAGGDTSTGASSDEVAIAGKG